MILTLPWLCGLVLAVQPIETHFAQVAPVPKDPTALVRSPGRERAVVLIHGLFLHPFSKENVEKAMLRSWQRPGSALVKRLAEDSDVFAFAYGQNDAVEEITELPDLDRHLRRLRQLGYRRLVLVGHSAGGLIARYYVEDHPDAGVSKVVQVCAPNGGSSWAHLRTVRWNQVGFLDSLTKEMRRATAFERADKKVPDNVEFACVVGNGTVVGDGVVSCRSQWTADLQRQGIPAFPVPTTHWLATRGHKGIEKIVELVREPQPRWDAGKVAAARKQLLLGD